MGPGQEWEVNPDEKTTSRRPTMRLNLPTFLSRGII